MNILTVTFVLIATLLKPAVISFPGDQTTAPPPASEAEAAAVASPGISAEPQADSDQAVDSETSEDSAAATSGEPQKYVLQYSFSKGQKLRYQTEQKMTQATQIGESSKVDVSTVDQNRIYTVQDVTDAGIAVIRMQFERIHMESKTDDKEPIVFDSSMKPEDVPRFFQHFAHRLKGISPVFHLARTGKAASVGTVTATETAADSPATKDDTAKSPESTESFLPPLPEQPVAIGETWTMRKTVRVRMSVDVNRDVEILQTFRLKSVEGDIATITSNASVMTAVRSPVIKSQLTQVTPRGLFRIDMKSGTLLMHELRYDETLLGAVGPNSVINTLGLHVDTLVPDVAQAAAASSAAQ